MFCKKNVWQNSMKSKIFKANFLRIMISSLKIYLLFIFKATKLKFLQSVLFNITNNLLEADLLKKLKNMYDQKKNILFINFVSTYKKKKTSVSTRCLKLIKN